MPLTNANLDVIIIINYFVLLWAAVIVACQFKILENVFRNTTGHRWKTPPACPEKNI